MPSFKCPNSDCDLHNVDIFTQKAKLIIESGRIISSPAIFCEKCKSVLEIHRPSLEERELGVSIGRFKSMSNYEKKLTLQARAKKDYKKNFEKASAIKKQETINAIKKSIEQ